MLCAQCNTENPERAKFCLECGARLDAAAAPAPSVPQDTIPQRIRRLVPQEYADRLMAAGGQMAGARRVVTILFSDIKGSSAMARDMDPEDVMEIMDGAFDVLIEPIMRYEGTLARLMGDAILAFFGAPITHEDDPERACRAALDIIAGGERYAERLREERSIEGFNVRVGINTGLVVVGEVGSDLRVEYTAMGEAINLAARMESAAEPGTILITEDTHKHIAPLFETQSLLPIEVKGWEEPVPVFRVLSPEELPGKVRGIEGLQSQMVGREAELGVLLGAVERLRLGEGGVVTIVGEAGIGKSRLVAELRRAAAGGEDAAALQWIEGRCLSYGGSMAYLLWLDVLHSALDVTLDASPGRVGEKLRAWVGDLCPDRTNDVHPYLARLLSLPLDGQHQKLLDDLGGQELRERTMAAVEIVVRCSAERAPLVLVLEDLHWADGTSLALLEHLLPLVENAPLLLVAVFRPYREHRSWQLREVAAEGHGERHVDLLLEPLTATHSQELVGNLLRVGGLPKELTARILARAEGNPFYVEEVIRSLLDEGTIAREEATGGWRVMRKVGDIAIPDTLQGVLVARIDRLQEDTRQVLQMASVIGRVFLYRLLAALASATAAAEATALAASERELDAHLSRLQREEMIRERVRLPELEYIFKHELTREAAYNGLLKRQRRVFHQQVGESLEELFAARADEILGLLAHHWERAGDGEKATEYLLRAGDQARVLYAHDEAVDYYERALALLRGGGDYGRAARTLMRLGLTHHSAFHYRESQRAYEEGFVLWQRASLLIPPSSPSAAPHAFRVRMHRLPSSLQLDTNAWAYQAEVVRQLFSGLVIMTPQLDVLPDVARQWEILEDGSRYIFHLRDDVRWSDRVPVTARDFEVAWKRSLDPSRGIACYPELFCLRGAREFHDGRVGHSRGVGVSAADDLTLIVDLDRPTGHFLSRVACSSFYPLPAHQVEQLGEEWADPTRSVTNGPFRIESWIDGERAVLVRNPHYHGRCDGNIERVEMRVLRDNQAIMELYRRDELDIVDLMWSFLPADRDLARFRFGADYITRPSLSSVWLTLNTRLPPFDDRRVRLAVAHATDRESFANGLYRGQVAPALGGLIPPGMPGHSPTIGLRYDSDRARALLAAAGTSSGATVVPLRLRSPQAGPFRQAAQYLGNQWQEILGLDVEPYEVPVGSPSDQPDREPPHMRFSAWIADYPDPAVFLGPNEYWDDPTYDRLINKAYATTDSPKRMALYRAADRRVTEEALAVPIMHLRWWYFVKPWVRRYLNDWKDVIIETH